MINQIAKNLIVLNRTNHSNVRIPHHLTDTFMGVIGFSHEKWHRNYFSIGGKIFYVGKDFLPQPRSKVKVAATFVKIKAD
ncbi:MAG: hypothetical protein RSE13_06025 [Planktothrix sp. GU0601_MAG3]|nr:MAG: hypothetical protein RSE13_06025 [Planktothrix sp. GU0601_MAG3]